MCKLYAVIKKSAKGCRFGNYSRVFFLIIYIGFHISLSGQTVIGGNTPDPSAMLDVQSTSSGMLMPRMTTAQRSAISSPAMGLMIYNTSIRCLEINMGTPTSPLWQKIGNTICGAYVAVGVWKEFMCHNLGANTDADPFTPSWELNGNYYQWGRNPTCFGEDGIDANNPCSSPVQGAAGPWGATDAQDNAGAISGWDLNTAPDGSWADAPAAKTANDPCPTGFRVPSQSQLDAVGNSNLNPRNTVGATPWISDPNNYSTGLSFGPALFLPNAGSRKETDGELENRGSTGIYWSTTEFGSSFSAAMQFYASGPLILNQIRTKGYSVRCVAE
jgi:uncharacterized protein (TIGR02145 family)